MGIGKNQRCQDTTRELSGGIAGQIHWMVVADVDVPERTGEMGAPPIATVAGGRRVSRAARPSRIGDRS